MTNAKHTPDIEYFIDGMFTRFVPNTRAGELAWNEMAKKEGVAAVLSMHSKSVINQLRNAGYVVAKAKPVKQSIDEILAELEVLTAAEAA